MVARLAVEIVNVRQLAAQWDRITYSLIPMRMALYLNTIFEPFMLERIENRFQGEGDDVTGRWAPLSYNTQRLRQWSGFAPQHPINVRTGDLRDWLLSEDASITINPAGASYSFPPDDAWDPVTQQKFETAQLGRAHPSTVARPVIGLGINDGVFALTSLATFLDKSFSGLIP